MAGRSSSLNYSVRSVFLFVFFLREVKYFHILFVYCEEDRANISFPLKIRGLNSDLSEEIYRVRWVQD